MKTSATTSTMMTKRNTTAITVSVRSIAVRTSPARLIMGTASAPRQAGRSKPAAWRSLFRLACREQRNELVERRGGRLAAAIEGARPLLADDLQLFLHLRLGLRRQRLEA